MERVLDLDLWRSTNSGSRREKGPLGANAIAQGHKALIDIVFVHGLNGGSLSTWTARDATNSWLETLTNDIPNSRIITCGYDTDIRFVGKLVSVDSVLGYAKTLLGDLDALRGRSSTTQRPLVFVAHSLGGLIVQEMIRWSKETSPTSSVYSNTEAVLFLGTPHRGSPWASSAMGLSKFTLNNTNKKPLEVLLPDSPMLESLSSSFNNILRSNSIRAICFYEEHPDPRLGKIIVPKQSASLDGREAFGLPSDHSGMTKFPPIKANFSSDQKTGYYRIMAHLKPVVQRATRDPKAFFRAIKDDDIAYVEEWAPAFDLNTEMNDQKLDSVGLAAMEGSMRVFKLLVVRFNADPDKPDEVYKQRPLFRAAKSWQPLEADETDAMPTKDHLGIVEFLVRWPGVDLDAQDKDGQTAIAAAAHKGVVECVRTLLDAGADPTICDWCQPSRTALSRAKMNYSEAEGTFKERLAQVIRMLEKHGENFASPECILGTGYINSYKGVSEDRKRPEDYALQILVALILILAVYSFTG